MHKQIVKTLYLSDKVYKQKTFVSLADLITLAFTLFFLQNVGCAVFRVLLRIRITIPN